eukprot:gene2712-1697_t
MVWLVYSVLNDCVVGCISTVFRCVTVDCLRVQWLWVSCYFGRFILCGLITCSCGLVYVRLLGMMNL